MNKSPSLYATACSLIPGGVNSPVRAWNAVGGEPFFVARGKGSVLTDTNGNTYIDYVGSWGPLILGHAHQEVIHAVKTALDLGFSYGAPTEREITLASMIVEAFPSIEMVRLVNSGTEATLSAVRLARAYTGRNKIIKMIGGYHGHHDALLAQAGSGMATLAIPSTPGVPPAVVQDTILVPYNDAEAVRTVFQQNPQTIAAIIVEPIAGNMGVVLPQPGYLLELRKLTQEFGALLIFDEVITGFRVAYGGAQTLFEIQPDLTTLGKIIGGGLPIGAYGGRAEIMQMMAPLGPVYQAGTLSGNPIATACGIATLQLIKSPDFYDNLEKKAVQLAEGLLKKAEEAQIPVQLNRCGSMMTLFFTDQPVTDFASVCASNTHRYTIFWRVMLEEGIYLPPSAFETMFVSSAHANSDFEKTFRASNLAFRAAAVA